MSNTAPTAQDITNDIDTFDRERPAPEALRALTALGPAHDYEEEISEIIDSIKLFEDLTRDEVGVLCKEMTCFAAKRGDRILCEGDPGDFLLIILTGEVAVVKEKDLEAPKLITVVGPGASLGEMSLIDGMPRFASCIAREPTDFAVLTRDNLYDILVFSPSLGNKLLLILLQVLTRRLRDTSEKLLPFITGIPV